MDPRRDLWYAGAMPEIRKPAEVKYQAELAALMAADQAPRPPGWRLSPRAVEYCKALPRCPSTWANLTEDPRLLRLCAPQKQSFASSQLIPAILQ